MSDEELRGQLVTLLFAGHETTATALDRYSRPMSGCEENQGTLAAIAAA
jgi:hypothetical protein